jgi:hypothetical protein
MTRMQMLVTAGMLLALAAPGWASGQEAGRKPTLFLIGDSTVKTGTPGHMGWGEPLADCFDAAKIRKDGPLATFLLPARAQTSTGRLRF